MPQQTLEDFAAKNHLDHLLNTLIDWSHKEAPDWFDDSFIHAMYIEHYEGVRGLTPRQVAALENIAEKFNVK